MYRPVVLGLAMLAGGAIGSVAVNARGQALGAPTPTDECSGTLDQRTTCLEGLITALGVKLSTVLSTKATEDEITSISLRIGTLEKLLRDQKMGAPGKSFSILVNPPNGTCPGADEVIVNGYCFVSGNRVPYPSMELLGDNRSAACSPPGSAIQMVLVCAKP